MVVSLKQGEKLGLSQSGVGHSISTLEMEIGIVLLHRNRNGISLTDAGVRIISHIRQIVRHANLLEQEAALITGCFFVVKNISHLTFKFSQMRHALFMIDSIVLCFSTFSRVAFLEHRKPPKRY